jgi:hypothetical protein
MMKMRKMMLSHQPAEDLKKGGVFFSVLLMFNGCIVRHQNGGADTTHHSLIKP